MPTVTSADGTTIAYDVTGNGPPIVLVDGAMCYRDAGPMRPLATQLQDQFTVFAYDRRGRGESTDSTAHSVAREVEDLRALIDQAGGEAYVYGISSGAALALTAAATTEGITKLALYEPPYMAEVGWATQAKEYSQRLHELLDAGERGDAVAWFMTYVGVPAEAIAGMKATPGWAQLEAIAPTLAYDAAALTDGAVPRELASTISVPVLLLAGGASPEDLQHAAKATAEAVPGASYRTLEGQTHDVAPEALASALIDFFTA